MTDNFEFDKSLFPSLNLDDPFEGEPSFGLDDSTLNAAPVGQFDGSSSWLAPSHESFVFDFGWPTFAPDTLDIGLFEGTKEASDAAEKSHATSEPPTSSTTSETRVPLSSSSSDPVEDSSSSDTDLTLPCLPPSTRPSHDYLYTTYPRVASGSRHLRPLDHNVSQEAELCATTSLQRRSSLKASSSLTDESERMTPPDLSESTVSTREASPTGPPTPSDKQYGYEQEAPSRSSSDTTPAVDEVTSGATPAVSLCPAPNTPSPKTEAPVLEPSSPNKRKRMSTKRTARHPDRPRTLSQRNVKKPFTINVRASSQRGSAFSIITKTVNAISCCELVDERGYCPFKTERDGAQVTCNQELPKDDKLLRGHFAVHFQERGYYEQEFEEGNFAAHCPFCDDTPTLFNGLMRHILHTELRVGTEQCECGGTMSRSNQANNLRRHKESARHKAYERKKEKSKAAHAEEEEQEVERSDNGERDEEQEVKALSVKEVESEKVEELEEFVQGSSKGLKRRCFSG